MRTWMKGLSERLAGFLLLLAAGCLLLAGSPGAVSAAVEEQCVYDNARLLSWSETAELEEICSGFFGNTGCHMLIFTDENPAGKDSQSLADDFYDEKYPEKEQENGVCLLIDMGERQITLSTAGVMRYYLSDREVDEILDAAASYASDGSYGTALEVMARMCQEAYDRGVSEGDYLVDETGRVIRYRTISRLEFFVAAATGVVAALLTFLGIRKRYQKKKRGDLRGSARLTASQIGRRSDQLINRNVVTRRIPRNPPPGGGDGRGGGGSSVHSSSSGRSHGGGSRGF